MSAEARFRGLPYDRNDDCKAMGMRKVVDSNYLRDEALEDYLSASSGNCVVMTDYVAMEAYKGEMPASILASMKILSKYPKQVIILKGTQAVCALHGHEIACSEQLIDVDQTRRFSDFCRHLELAQRGDPAVLNALLELGREAIGHMDRILLDMPKVSVGFNEAAKAYTADELKIIRNGSSLTSKMADKLIHNFMLLAVHLFEKMQDVATISRGPEVRNMFIFRYALCIYILNLKWISVGGTSKTKIENIRNDIVDVNFATFATYFDGMLSNDRKAQEIFTTADYLLREILVMSDA
jgi:hypothetical protein